MPTLHRHSDRPAYYVRGVSHGKPVHFDLTAEGEQYLLTTLGLVHGSKFSGETLKWLYARKWAIAAETPASEPVVATPAPAPREEPLRYESNPVVFRGIVQIRLTASEHVLVDQAAEEVVRILTRTGVAVFGPVPLPVTVEPFVVLRDTGRRVYEVRRYQRVLQVRQPRRQTSEAMNHFSLPREVDVQVQMHPADTPQARVGVLS